MGAKRPCIRFGRVAFGAGMGTGDRLDLEGGLRELLSFASVSLISRSRRDDMTGFWNMEHGTCLSSLARRKKCTHTGKEAMCAGESESAWFPPWPPYGVSKEWKALIGTCTTTLQKATSIPSVHVCPLRVPDELPNRSARAREGKWAPSSSNGLLPCWLPLPVHSEAQPWTSTNSQGFAYAFLAAGAGAASRSRSACGT